jgi:hypothetical protein
MSEVHVNQVTILAALTKGITTRNGLAEYFEVEPSNEFLRRALNDLEHHGHIAWDRKTGAVTAK